jgi:uncharacterized protein (DUF305 family)
MSSVVIRIAAPFVAVSVGLIAAAVMSSCGRGPSTNAGAMHNAADATFAEMMIPHHQQALDMADLVPSRTTNQDLLVLAKHIALDQGAEIQTLRGLLAQWGEPVPPDHANRGMTMTGMVDDATMSRLPSLQGQEFDTLWIRSMILHHQGAVDMAQTEIAHGQNPDALNIANIIISSQQREIAYMNHLLSVAQ